MWQHIPLVWNFNTAKLLNIENVNVTFRKSNKHPFCTTDERHINMFIGRHPKSYIWSTYYFNSCFFSASRYKLQTETFNLHVFNPTQISQSHYLLVPSLRIMPWKNHKCSVVFNQTQKVKNKTSRYYIIK